MRIIFFFIFFLNFAQVGWSQSIDIETAWQRVISYSPSIAAADTEISVLEAEAVQVSLRFNPVFEVESENIGISNPSDDVEPPQTTFSLSQILELGGKRAARFDLASALSDIAYWDAQIEREDAYFKLVLAFIEVRTTQEKWGLASERLAVSERILEVVHKQIQNGKVSPIHEKKARIELMAAELAVREALSNYKQAKTYLSSMWGSSCPDFDHVDFELYAFSKPPCQAVILEGFYQTPDFNKAQQVIDSASQNLALQKANRIPDLTLMAGYRVFHDSNEGGWVVGAEMPLPFFNRNQGSIQSAVCGLSQAEHLLDEIAREAQEKILVTYEKLIVSYEESGVMCEKILTEAQETVRLIETGHQKGRFEYLDLLDAQKMLFEIQEKCIDILCEYHLNRAQLARLSGTKL